MRFVDVVCYDNNTINPDPDLTENIIIKENIYIVVLGYRDRNGHYILLTQEFVKYSYLNSIQMYGYENSLVYEQKNKDSKENV